MTHFKAKEPHFLIWKPAQFLFTDETLFW